MSLGAEGVVDGEVGNKKVGDSDVAVPTLNSVKLARRLLSAQLEIYEVSRHVGIFQPHQRFVRDAIGFLTASGGDYRDAEKVDASKCFRCLQYLDGYVPAPRGAV